MTAPTTARVTVVQHDREAHEDRRFDIDVPIDLLTDLGPEEIAEAIFCAVDEPQMHCDPRYDGSLMKAVAEAVLPRREIAQVGDMRGFMIGDVVEFGDTQLICETFGWARP